MATPLYLPIVECLKIKVANVPIRQRAVKGVKEAKVVKDLFFCYCTATWNSSIAKSETMIKRLAFQRLGLHSVGLP